MTPGLYKLHFHSLVRWTRLFNEEASLATGTRIEFINWDAHYEGRELPKTDLVGISDYQIVADRPETNIFVAWVVSVFNDPDLVRQVEIVDMLVERLRDGAVLPVWKLDGTVLAQESWMMVTGEVDVESQKRDAGHRPYLAVTTRLVTGLSGLP